MALAKYLKCCDQKKIPTWAGMYRTEPCKEDAKYMSILTNPMLGDIDGFPYCAEHLPKIGRSRDITSADIEKYGKK